MQIREAGLFLSRKKERRTNKGKPVIPMIVEIIRYKLHKEAKLDDFLKAAEKMVPDLKNQPGLIDWQLCKKENGNWLEILHWNNLEEAKTAAKKVIELDSVKVFIKFIDEPTTESAYFETVKKLKN